MDHQWSFRDQLGPLVIYLDFFGDEKLPSYTWDYFISHEISGSRNLNPEMECHKSWCWLTLRCSLGDLPGLFNNTLVIYILGDNGASAEGFHGTIDELLTENSLPNTAKQQIEAHLCGE